MAAPSNSAYEQYRSTAWTLSDTPLVSSLIMLDSNASKIRGSRDCEAFESGGSDEPGEFRDSGEASAELESAFVDFENPDLVLKRRWRNAKLGCGA